VFSLSDFKNNIKLPEVANRLNVWCVMLCMWQYPDDVMCEYFRLRRSTAWS